ncbi:hypothetical protein ACT024_26305, partial [Enterobacter mori]|uniref:hypothetical protein n=1 Tax=Enterobacter mori TaxID=539813 RepID=UPI00402AFEE1
VRHIFKPISYLEIQLLSGVSGGYINFPGKPGIFLPVVPAFATGAKTHQSEFRNISASSTSDQYLTL